MHDRILAPLPYRVRKHLCRVFKRKNPNFKIPFSKCFPLEAHTIKYSSYLNQSPAYACYLSQFYPIVSSHPPNYSSSQHSSNRSNSHYCPDSVRQCRHEKPKILTAHAKPRSMPATECRLDTDQLLVVGQLTRQCTPSDAKCERCRDRWHGLLLCWIERIFGRALRLRRPSRQFLRRNRALLGSQIC